MAKTTKQPPTKATVKKPEPKKGERRTGPGVDPKTGKFVARK